MKKILITGSAGFIGFHLFENLLQSDYNIVGLDNINDYYDVKLKYARLEKLGFLENKIFEKELISSSIYSQHKFLKVDLTDHDFIVDFMMSERFDYVVHLAAQAGVRYSIENPRAYTKSNIDGFLSVIEGARYSEVKHFLYASTSSVYGLNTRMPLNESMPTEHPMALYAATKKANEMMAHSYSHLFNIPTTGLRFFTVYGPWGRPDMALFLFTKSIHENYPIKLFNGGKMTRDFTYVIDIVESIKRLIHKPAESNKQWNGDDPDIATSSAPYRIFNIGNSSPVNLENYINAIEENIGNNAIKEFLPMQPGDVPSTNADTRALSDFIDFHPSTDIKTGVRYFVEWYLDFYVNKKEQS
jgi:UDP-glucuronate 4-epimerase